MGRLLELAHLKSIVCYELALIEEDSADTVKQGFLQTSFSIHQHLVGDYSNAIVK